MMMVVSSGGRRSQRDSGEIDRVGHLQVRLLLRRRMGWLRPQARQSNTKEARNSSKTSCMRLWWVVLASWISAASFHWRMRACISEGRTSQRESAEKKKGGDVNGSAVCPGSENV